MTWFVYVIQNRMQVSLVCMFLFYESQVHYWCILLYECAFCHLLIDCLIKFYFFCIMCGHLWFRFILDFCFDNLTFLSYLFSLVLFFLVMNRLFLRTLKTTRLPERNVIDVLNTLFFNPVLFKYDQNSPNALWFWDC